MKLKATVTDAWKGANLFERYALAKLAIHFNSPELARYIYDDVLVPFTKVPQRNSEKSWHAGDYFVQETDRSSPWDPFVVGVDVTLSGVSVTLWRSPADLWTSLDAIRNICTTLIAVNLLRDMKAHLMVRMALDQQIPYLDNSSLLEHPAIWISGTADYYAVSEDMVLEAELIARLGTTTGRALFQTLASNNQIKIVS